MRLHPQPPTDFRTDRGPDLIPDTGPASLTQGWFRPKRSMTVRGVEYTGTLDHPGYAYAPGKVFLGRVDQRPMGLADNRHVVTVAGSRGGKTACILIPNLRLYPGSCFVIDPKGEIARMTARERAAMGHDVHVVDPWGQSLKDDGDAPGLPREFLSAFDPLGDLAASLPPDLDLQETVTDDAGAMAEALVQEAGENNVHWTESARNLVRALILWVLVDGDADGAPGGLSRLPTLLAQISGADDPASNLALRMAAYSPDPALPDIEAVIRNVGAGLVNSDDRERGNVLSTARAQLTFLESPALRRALTVEDGGRTFALADLKARPTTVYLCLPAGRMGTHARWLRLILGMAMVTLERWPTTAQQRALPVTFILEEFAALGHMRTLESAVAYMAGFGVRLWPVLQDLTQLKRHYKDGWETFIANAGIVQAFNVSDVTTLKWLSDKMGETTLEIVNKQAVTTQTNMGGDPGTRREFRNVPLLAPAEIEREFSHLTTAQGGSAGGLTLVLRAGSAPFVVDRVFYGDVADWSPQVEG